jgi:transposase InsO family protein
MAKSSGHTEPTRTSSTRCSYRDDVDLDKKLAVWERFYNYDRPHGAHGGKTPYEALQEKLS